MKTKYIISIMSNELNSRYFLKVFDKPINDNYNIYKPIGAPLILFSKFEKIPLAAIHFKCQNNINQSDELQNKGKSVITKLFDDKNKINFFGITNKNNQEYELVITNLTNIGYINFNIFKKNRLADQVNPKGLNEINELRPMESYSVQCDQLNNKVLLLNKNKVINYYLSVVPQINNPFLVQLFDETYWDCVDFICIKNQNKNLSINKIKTRSIIYQNKKLFNHEFKRFNNSFENLIPIKMNSKNKKLVMESGFTGMEYAYNMNSNTCKLTLCIEPNLELKNSCRINEILKLGKNFFYNWIQEEKGGKVEQENIDYTNIICPICLKTSSKNPINCIFIQCGHSCTHYSCGQFLKRCPICKKVINGQIMLQPKIKLKSEIKSKTILQSR